MQVNLYYEYASIIISVLLFIYFSATKKSSSFHNHLFLLIIIDNTFTAIFDVINKLIDYNGGKVLYLDITTMGYFITHILVLPLLFFYILSSISSWYGLSGVFKGIIISPIFIALLILFSNPITHFVYSYGADGSYIKGPGYIMLYVVVGFYVLSSFGLLFALRDYFSVVRRTIFSTNLIVIGISMVIQALYYELRVETFGITYCTLIMFYLLQNPNDQIDKETNAYNKKSFLDVMNLNMASKKYFNLIEIIISDFEDVTRIDKDENGKTIAGQMVDFFKNDLEGDITIYRIDHNVFCLELKDVPEEGIIKIIKTISNRFMKPWMKRNYEIIYKMKMCHLSIPEDIDNIDQLIGVVTGSQIKEIKKDILFVSDFDLNRFGRLSGLNVAIAKAIEGDKLEVVFSPICDVETKRIVAVDTSVRIFDSNVGNINQNDIKEYTERNGKADLVAKQIVNKVCKFVAENNPKSLGIKYIGLELTASMCYQKGFVDYIIKIINEKKIDPSIICFKLSEYTISKMPNEIKSIMERLRKEGYSFGLEDYGSGYTNIASIYEYNFDIIKISDSVVNAAYENEKAKITLKSSIELSADLGMATVAGGIKDEDYFNMLVGSGCKCALGNYFYENINEKEFMNILIAQENIMAVSNFGVNKEADNLLKNVSKAISNKGNGGIA